MNKYIIWFNKKKKKLVLTVNGLEPFELEYD